MKKKTVIGLIIVVVLVIGGYFGYQGYHWIIYNTGGYVDENLQLLYDNLVFKDTIVVQTEPTDYYLEFQNVKVKNIFQEFEKPGHLNTIENSEKYVLYDEEHKVKASFWIGISESYVERFQHEFALFVDTGGYNVDITEKDMIAFFQKHQITNDMELYEYLHQQKVKKDNIFTSIKQMRENYIVRNIISIAIPSVDSLTRIEGDRTGYSFNIDNKIKQVSILENDKCYIFTFMGTDYFDDAIIQEILNSVVIGET